MNVQQSMMTEALRRWRIIPVIVIDEPKNAVPLAPHSLPVVCPSRRSRFALPQHSNRCVASRASSQRCSRASALCSTSGRRSRRGRRAHTSSSRRDSVVASSITVSSTRSPFIGVATAGESFEPTPRSGRSRRSAAFPTSSCSRIHSLAAVPDAAASLNRESLKNVVACGGPWMAPAEWIASEQFDKISAAVRDTVTRATRLTPARKSPVTPRPAIHEAARPR